MSARHKLNAAHFNGSVFIAAVIGLLGQSWILFFVVAVLALALNVHTGGIRPQGRDQRPTGPRSDPRRPR